MHPRALCRSTCRMTSAIRCTLIHRPRRIPRPSSMRAWHRLRSVSLLLLSTLSHRHRRDPRPQKSHQLRLHRRRSKPRCTTWSRVLSSRISSARRSTSPIASTDSCRAPDATNWPLRASRSACRSRFRSCRSAPTSSPTRSPSSARRKSVSSSETGTMRWRSERRIRPS
jgi:hypothetical protein